MNSGRPNHPASLPNARDDEDRYLDLVSLSAYSCLSVRSLRLYLSDPADPLPSYCVRRKILVKKSDFDRWLTKKKVPRRALDALVDEVLADVL